MSQDDHRLRINVLVAGLIAAGRTDDQAIKEAQKLAARIEAQLAPEKPAAGAGDAEDPIERWKCDECLHYSAAVEIPNGGYHADCPNVSRRGRWRPVGVAEKPAAGARQCDGCGLENNLARDGMPHWKCRERGTWRVAPEPAAREPKCIRCGKPGRALRGGGARCAECEAQWDDADDDLDWMPWVRANPITPAAPDGAAPKCDHCGERPATCVGQYDNMTVVQAACDKCCQHGGEDGSCRPIDPPLPTPDVGACAHAEVTNLGIARWCENCGALFDCEGDDGWTYPKAWPDGGRARTLDASCDNAVSNCSASVTGKSPAAGRAKEPALSTAPDVGAVEARCDDCRGEGRMPVGDMDEVECASCDGTGNVRPPKILACEHPVEMRSRLQDSDWDRCAACGAVRAGTNAWFGEIRREAASEARDELAELIRGASAWLVTTNLRYEPEALRLSEKVAEWSLARTGAGGKAT